MPRDSVCCFQWDCDPMRPIATDSYYLRRALSSLNVSDLPDFLVIPAWLKAG